jgi:hypothetical protein
MKTDDTIDKYKAKLAIKDLNNKKVLIILTHIHLYQE